MNHVKVKKGDMEALSLVVMLDSRIFDPPWTVAQWSAEIDNPANKVVIMYMDTAKLYPFGFMSYSIVGDVLELKKIGILPEYRRKKFGALSMDVMLYEAWKKKVHNVIIEVAVTNIPAIRLYEKLGFYKIGVRKKYYQNTVDAIVMQKEL